VTPDEHLGEDPEGEEPCRDHERPPGWRLHRLSGIGPGRSEHQAGDDDHRQMIADSAMELYQCKLMVLYAAYKIDRGDDFKSEVSMAKHFVANSLGRILDRAIQVHGALGYSNDTPLASMFLHARWARFADGADEIHQMRIAERTIAAYTDNGTTRAATGDLPI
jgi:alkylation response protein AidB-like acyl-CoA dehydrogenase